MYNQTIKVLNRVQESLARALSLDRGRRNYMSFKNKTIATKITALVLTVLLASGCLAVFGDVPVPQQTFAAEETVVDKRNKWFVKY